MFRVRSLKNFMGGKGDRFQVAPAKRQEYNGRWYRSRSEATFAAQLDLRLRGKDIVSWKYEPQFSLDVNGLHICNYRPDFEVRYPNGDIEYVEVKGYMANTPEFRFKWKLFEALFGRLPGVRLLLVPT